MGRVKDLLPDDWDGYADIGDHPEESEVIVCAGTPSCRLEGDAAVEAAQAGCPLCRHIVCNMDGTETEYALKPN